MTETARAVRFPKLNELPAGIPIDDVGRMIEAMLAGLGADPPDTFVDDWEESVEEGKRLLEEIRQEYPR